MWSDYRSRTQSKIVYICEQRKVEGALAKGPRESIGAAVDYLREQAGECQEYEYEGLPYTAINSGLSMRECTDNAKVTECHA